MRIEDWFLGPDERGNRSSGIAAWTEGNLVQPLIHGARYFERLSEALADLPGNAQVRFTDWRGDGDENLSETGPTVAAALADACARGVDVRGLLWRSHSDRASFNKQENRQLAGSIDRCGGEVLLDERVRRGGSHHQKLVLLRRPGDEGADVAFVGGVDLAHGRRDDAVHLGDPQPISIDGRYGTRPPWHDIQLEVRGPAIDDLDRTFRERWEDPTPLDHSGMARALFSRAASRERRTRPLPQSLPAPPPAGPHAVQVLRTYPARRPRYPFAPQGERSVALAFIKAVERARRLIYIEDQYFWSVEMANVLADALRREPKLQLIVVLPRYPDKDSRLAGPPSRLAQERATTIVREAGGGRTGFFDLQNGVGTPVYVHAKACVIDDVWASVGSDNLNRRSWTNDSEVACAVLDANLDEREPTDPGGRGDGARCFARDLRLTLWAEHLDCDVTDVRLLDLDHAVELWRSSGGRAREHRNATVPAAARQWADLIYRLVYDPDGRPLNLRRRRAF